MSDIAKRLYILVLFGFFDDAYAQLPPEIMSDRYLVKAELLEAKKDYAGAFNVMEKIIALHKANDLKLPVDFHLKYARVALAAASIRIAYDSVNRYLTTAGRDGAFYKDALLLSLEAEEELEVPEILPDDTCVGKGDGAECWMELTSHPGCYVWEGFFWRSSSVTWSGGCYGKVARGRGTLVWTLHDQVHSYSGLLRQGKRHGQWVFKNERGTVSEGTYVNGKKHGHWILHSASNYKERGDYIDGNQDGTWLRYYRDPSNGEESCTSVAYRQGQEVSSGNVDLAKCEGW